MATWRLWPLDQGQGSSCPEGGFLGSGSAGLRVLRVLQALRWPVGQAALAWPGWQELHGVAAFTPCPSLRQEALHGGTSLRQAQPDPD